MVSLALNVALTVYLYCLSNFLHVISFWLKTDDVSNVESIQWLPNFNQESDMHVVKRKHSMERSPHEVWMIEEEVIIWLASEQTIYGHVEVKMLKKTPKNETDINNSGLTMGLFKRVLLSLVSFVEHETKDVLKTELMTNKCLKNYNNNNELAEARGKRFINNEINCKGTENVLNVDETFQIANKVKVLNDSSKIIVRQPLINVEKYPEEKQMEKSDSCFLASIISLNEANPPEKFEPSTKNYLNPSLETDYCEINYSQFPISECINKHFRRDIIKSSTNKTSCNVKDPRKINLEKNVTTALPCSVKSIVKRSDSNYSNVPDYLNFNTPKKIGTFFKPNHSIPSDCFDSITGAAESQKAETPVKESTMRQNSNNHSHTTLTRDDNVIGQEYEIEFDGESVAFDDALKDHPILILGTQKERRIKQKHYIDICRTFETNNILTVHGRIYYVVIGSLSYLLTVEEFKTYFDVSLPDDHSTKLMFNLNDPRIKLLPP